MKSKLTSIIAIRQATLHVITSLIIAIAFLTINPAIAGTVKSTEVNTAKQASQEVVKDTGVKQQFGKSENGEQLLDQASAKASQNLDRLAQEANSNPDLPESKKLFLKNLHN